MISPVHRPSERMSVLLHRSWAAPTLSLPWFAFCVAGAVATGYLALHAYRADEPMIFYAAILILALLAVLALRSVGLTRLASIRTFGATLVISVLLLPIADAIYSWCNPQFQEKASPKPVYTFREAKGDPKAFSAWWEYYAQQWLDARKILTKPDPKGVLPSVMVPNAERRVFGNVIKNNNFGFLGRDLSADKGNNYRIFVTGESPAWGAMIERDARPWPGVLQALINRNLVCLRPIQVMNAGAPAYRLMHSIERLKRDILPLQPDLVISSHGYNGLSLLASANAGSYYPEPRVERVNRASVLLGEIEYRLRLARYIRNAHSFAQSKKYPMELALKSAYADLYRELIQIGRDHGFTVVLTSQSAAVTSNSPAEVIEFYGQTFLHLEESIAGLEAHNRMVEEIARQSNVPFIDTTPGVAGGWDEDLFLDPVHFTQKGANRVADRMFEGLKPILAAEPLLRCSEKTPSTAR